MAVGFRALACVATITVSLASSNDAARSAAGAPSASKCEADGDDPSALQSFYSDVRKGGSLSGTSSAQDLDRSGSGVSDSCPCSFFPALQQYRDPPERRPSAVSPMEFIVGTAQLCDIGVGLKPSLAGSSASWFTRAYGSTGGGGADLSAQIPGPTIRVRPGEYLNFTVRNALVTDNGCGYVETHDNMTTMPNYCDVNITNMHTHGLHVSPLPGGDDVFESWPNGSFHKFSVLLPEDHTPGTFWYHPHRHHATADEAGGGMHGALIVDDPPGVVPPEVANMPEKIVVISLVDMRLDPGQDPNLPGNHVSSSPEIEQDAIGDLWKYSNGSYVNRNAIYALTNGMYIPKMELREGEWVRLRTIYAAIEFAVTLEPLELFPDSGFTCELGLLAKDGVYLNVVPRTVGKIYLAPGARADFAIRCSCSEDSDGCEGSLSSAAEAPATEFELPKHLKEYSFKQNLLKSGEAPEGSPCTGKYLEPFKHWLRRRVKGSHITHEKAESGPHQGIKETVVLQEILRISVLKAKPAKPQEPLRQFSPARPCYLVDLRRASVPPEQQSIISLPAPAAGIPWPVVYYSNKSAPYNYTGEPMTHIEDWPPLHTMEVGTVQEMLFTGPPFGSEGPGMPIGGLLNHPIHIHVLQYQIQSLKCNTTTAENESWVGPFPAQGCPDDNYFMTGDWHDTLMLTGGSAVTRMQFTRFTGKYVIHCHILSHEDKGMMAYFNVTGVEGTLWPGAKEIDPKCYYTSLEQQVSNYTYCDEAANGTCNQ